MCGYACVGVSGCVCLKEEVCVCVVMRVWGLVGVFV